jgi:NDP-sugar pyrophosphorylase family protein
VQTTDTYEIEGDASGRKHYFGNGKDFDVNIEYAEQKQQLGTAYAIKQVKDLVEGEFLVLNGDNLVSEETITDLTEKHAGGVSILTAARSDATGYALVEERDGKVLKITEGMTLKGVCNVNTGIYIFGLGRISLMRSMRRLSPSSVNSGSRIRYSGWSMQDMESMHTEQTARGWM